MTTALPSTVESDLQYILDIVGDICPTDELRPGLTLSFVDKGMTYAAVVRWPKRDVKLVAVSCKAPSLKAALKKLKGILIGYVNEGQDKVPFVSSTAPASAPAPSPFVSGPIALRA